MIDRSLLDTNVAKSLLHLKIKKAPMIAGSGCIARKPQADIVAILQAWELKKSARK